MVLKNVVMVDDELLDVILHRYSHWLLLSQATVMVLSHYFQVQLMIRV